MKKFFVFAAAGLLSAVNLTAQDAEFMKPYKVGGYEVYVLVEGSGPGSTDILIDAPVAVVGEYAHDGVFPIATNAVLIKGAGKIWLVDTGYGRNVFNQMAELGVSAKEIDYVLLTHMHGDHIGGMFRDGEKSFPNAEIVVSKKEHAYWSSVEEMNKQPENRRGGFTAAQKVFSDYGDKLSIVEPQEIGDELEDGIAPVVAYGHTPGHITYMITDGWDQLLIWGDLTHAMAVQMPHPEISVTYDVDPDMARASRLEILRHVADKAIPVVGMHVPADYPGLVSPDGNDSYSFEVLPIE